MAVAAGAFSSHPESGHQVAMSLGGRLLTKRCPDRAAPAPQKVTSALHCVEGFAKMASDWMPVLVVVGAAWFACEPALAASSCDAGRPRRPFSVQGSVISVGAANSLVADFGYSTVVAIRDKKRGCTANVQTSSVIGCAAGKIASASGTTFNVPFTSVVLRGADRVVCR